MTADTANERPRAPRHGGLDAGRPARPSPVLHVRHRPPLRPRQRGVADRRRHRLRDVGHARRHGEQRRAAVPRLDRRQPRHRPRRPRAPGARLVGGRWSGPASRSTPTAGSSSARTCSAGARASTGPASPHPADGRPYASRFPVITIRDMVRAQARLADHLGVDRWHAVVGGSMGGMQVLEWAITYPHRVRSIVPIATCMQATAQQIAWGAIGRRAIALDPRWRGGEYYDAEPGDGPEDGLADRPDGRPGDVPQRQRVHRPLRPRPRRPAGPGRHVRAVAAVRGRALPRAPRRQARPALRHQQLPGHRQGDGPPRRRPQPRATWPRRWPGSPRRRSSSASPRTCCTRTTSSARSTRSCARRACGAATSRSTHRTGTTPS